MHRIQYSVRSFVHLSGLYDHSIKVSSPPAHATQIVLDANVPAVMIPLNVTHTAIVTKEIHEQLLAAKSTTTPLRRTLSTLISFFAETYKSTFGFVDGPPLHDALTVAYVANPQLFKTRRHRVDVELAPSHTIGETVVDIWNYQKASDDTWGPGGKNCIVTESLDVGASLCLAA